MAIECRGEKRKSGWLFRRIASVSVTPKGIEGTVEEMEDPGWKPAMFHGM
jgi:hypothetical protein